MALFTLTLTLQTREEIGFVNEIGCGPSLKEEGGMSLSEILLKKNQGEDSQ